MRVQQRAMLTKAARKVRNEPYVLLCGCTAYARVPRCLCSSSYINIHVPLCEEGTGLSFEPPTCTGVTGGGHELDGALLLIPCKLQHQQRQQQNQQQLPL